MIIHQKIRLHLSSSQELLIDEQFRLCNKLYNELLEYSNKNKDLIINNHRVTLKYLFKEFYRLRNNHLYYSIIHKSVWSHIIFNLKKDIEKASRSINSTPSFKKASKHSFTLFYETSFLVKRITKNNISIPLGFSLKEGRLNRIYLDTQLKDRINLRKDGKILKYEIAKKYNYYYLLVCIEHSETTNLPKTGKTVSIDPNHKNFFMAIDNHGISIELENLYQLKYFDEQISLLRSKRDKCIRNVEIYKTKSNNDYNIPSKRYSSLNKKIIDLYDKRDAQITQALYTIANYLVTEYDEIAIGDYSIANSFIPYREMRRKMINLSVISKFRKILKYTCVKNGKRFILVDERNTTKTCFSCGYKEKKDPSIRIFICPQCKKQINRDINSAINIGIKGTLLSSQDYVGIDLSNPTYTAHYDLYNQKIVFCN